MNKNTNTFRFLLGIFLFLLISSNPALGPFIIVLLVLYYKSKPDNIRSLWLKYQSLPISQGAIARQTNRAGGIISLLENQIHSLAPIQSALSKQTRLEKRKKYLQVALNSTLNDALNIISHLPVSDRILIETGTPLLKIYGSDAIRRIKNTAPRGAYIVADNKCTDLAAVEVRLMAQAGANAATCLGVAPIETIDNFIEECGRHNIDSMIDMMNVDNALTILRKLKNLPRVVILHRGVDESELSKEKQIPYYQIKQIKGSFDIMVAVAGGDTASEVQSAIFNDADIVVVWKNFYESSDKIREVADGFLKEVK